MELVGAMNAIIIVIIVTDHYQSTGLPLQFVFTVNRIGTGFKHLNKPIQKI